MHKIRLANCLLAVVVASFATSTVVALDLRARVARVLKATPLIDGHNDWPEVLAEREGDGRWTVDLRNRLASKDALYNTAGYGRSAILVRMGVAQSARA